MNYRKLKGKIKEVFDTQAAFAEAMGLSSAAIGQRLNGSIEWKTTDIAKACELLGIDLADAWEYFFVKKL